MKVTKFGRARERTVPEGRGRSSLSVEQSTFLDSLQEKAVRQVSLDAALEMVDRLSRDLRRNPTFEHLFRYKKAIRGLLQRLIKEMYVVEEKISYDALGRRHLYVMVEEVDKKLEELTRLFLQRELPSLELARRLDEIRGMVLDLYT